jgi:phosphoribosylanthranilate isomerase
MTKIKICGLSRERDIDYVNECKPDYIGFVFAPSKRQVSPEKARALAARLSNGILVVGVFVNAPKEEILKIADRIPLDVVQLHGDETEAEIKALQTMLSCEVWKAIRVTGAAQIKSKLQTLADRVLVDTQKENEYGGSGESFDWTEAEEFGTNIILAGGINEKNITQAINLFHPYAVDVSSGVETGGVKDKEKIRKLIETVRDYDEQNR